MFGRNKGVKKQGSGDFEGVLLRYEKLKAYDMLMGSVFFIIAIKTFFRMNDMFLKGAEGNYAFIVALINFIMAVVATYFCVIFFWKDKLGYVKLGRQTVWLNYTFKEKSLDLKEIRVVFPVEDKRGMLTYYRIVTDKNKMYDINLRYFKSEDMEQIKIYFKKNLKKNFRG